MLKYAWLNAGDYTKWGIVVPSMFPYLLLILTVTFDLK
jgi:hypothetical protein